MVLVAFYCLFCVCFLSGWLGSRVCVCQFISIESFLFGFVRLYYFLIYVYFTVLLFVEFFSFYGLFAFWSYGLLGDCLCSICMEVFVIFLSLVFSYVVFGVWVCFSILCVIRFYVFCGFWFLFFVLGFVCF